MTLSFVAIEFADSPIQRAASPIFQRHLPAPDICLLLYPDLSNAQSTISLMLEKAAAEKEGLHPPKWQIYRLPFPY